jgi:NitT/TauT family transport system ATP-binding protein
MNTTSELSLAGHAVAAAAEAAAPPRADVSVEVSGVTKHYRTAKGGAVHALDEVSLSFKPGEFVSIVGPSGCGKSTLMMLMSGLIPVSSGTIRVGGKEVRGPVREAGIVFQRDVLLDWRTVLSNVMLPVEIKGLDPATYRKKAHELLQSVGLAEFEEKYPGELSGGMRQRVAICRALVQHPSLLLMDEPFGALDALTREQMNLDLQRMWLRDRNTVLFITHSIEEAVFLADRVVVMSARPGTITEVLDIDLARPRGASTRSDRKFVEYIERIRRRFLAQGILSES